MDRYMYCLIQKLTKNNTPPPPPLFINGCLKFNSWEREAYLIKQTIIAIGLRNYILNELYASAKIKKENKQTKPEYGLAQVTFGYTSELCGDI